MIFDESIKGKQVNYTLATNMINNEGEFYVEYGCHDEKYSIDAIFYDGYRDTKVFAYIGIPKNNAFEKVPAMVLVHGGRGKAEIDWVKKWNDKGIAAISMDLYGDGPEEDTENPYVTGKKKHPYAGMYPWNDYETAFLYDHENAGMYQNVYNVINAVNLLTQIEKVDSERIGIVGISWGGITTLTTSGVDDRLKCAIAIYGCGFLNECKTYFHSVYRKGDPIWDPANYAAAAKFPILLINGDNDKHFSLNSSSYTYKVLKKGYLSVHHGLKHSQEDGDSIKQAYNFAEHILFGMHSFINVMECKVIKEENIVRITLENMVNTQQYNPILYYITTEELGYGGEDNVVWKYADSYRFSENVLEMDIPSEATFFYVSIEDGDDNVFSTQLIENPK